MMDGTERITHDCATIRPLLEEFAIDVADAADARAVQEHLAVCDVCRSELARIRGELNGLYEIGPRAKPPEHLWDRVLDRVREVETELVPGSTVVRAQEGEWVPSDVPGVRIKLLSENEASGERSVLVEMAPGAVYPAHDHPGTEECFILSGDLVIGDLRLTRGDYQRMEAGSRHESLTSTEGCVVLVIATAA